MQDIFGSVRRSLVFRSPMTDGEGGGEDYTAAGSIVEKINSRIRKSRVFSSKPSPPRQPAAEDNAPPPPPTIRWRKGELIGCGAFGQVYMGMNLISGELLAVKQVLIPANHASKDKAQIHVKEIEEEVKLLQNLSHPNIVRYLGTVREEGSLNILLEFVPGGSIASLLGKFGSFPESVIRMYSKQLLLGLDYLHKNGIMHRDIKGANILVDNKGCIKLADFGASKQVVELATVSGAKSMKGTPYWMAPEVICQTGHSFSADIWSVGCTVIEMATGKPPWSQQYQEVAAALFYIGTTKAHPPIPEHLSAEAKDFLLKCLQKEPELRPTAKELLQHPFITGELLQSTPVTHSLNMESPQSRFSTCAENNGVDSMDICNLGTLDCSTINAQEFSESRNMWEASNGDNDMCQIDDEDDFVVDGEANFGLSVNQGDFSKSFNPIIEPSYDWRSQNDESPVLAQPKINLDDSQERDRPAGSSASPGHQDNDFSFSCGPSLSEDDDEVTDSKIRAFLDEKALELKKLQTPLYEEFFNSLNPSCSHNLFEAGDDDAAKYLKLPPKSRSPNRGPTTTPSSADAVSLGSPGSGGRHISSPGSGSNQDLPENSSPQRTDLKGLVDTQQEPSSPSQMQRKWREELDQELERKREMMRQAGAGGKTSSPKDRAFSRPRSRFASPGR